MTPLEQLEQDIARSREDRESAEPEDACTYCGEPELCCACDFSPDGNDGIGWEG